MKTKACVTAFVLLMSGCATPLSQKAEQVQVHSQLSNLLDSCKRLAPVNGVGESYLYPMSAIRDAKRNLRENAADLGADTVAILNTDLDDAVTNSVAHMQGIAFKCY